MNYLELNKYDTANGPGIRVSLFIAGCTLKCKGCFNKESWDFNAGKPFTKDTLAKVYEYLSKPYITGLSILGGDPLEPQNQTGVLSLVNGVHTVFPNKTIWLWTGRTYKTIKSNPILNYIDTLVDGPYIEHLKEDLPFRGSSNQNIIFLRK